MVGLGTNFIPQNNLSQFSHKQIVILVENGQKIENKEILFELVLIKIDPSHIL
jgi:hypothetical protein